MFAVMRTHGMASLALALVALLASGCGYNTLVTENEAVDGAWSEVQNQLQRRNDLVPNLVETVKGFAKQEQEVLVKVTEARSRVAGAGTPAETMAASNELSNALSRLLVVVENYPQLKSDALFRDLQAQLEGTENRITTARNRFIKAVQDYNILARQFPTNLTAMLFGYKEKASFTVENEKAISEPPKVDFAPKSAVPAAPSGAPSSPAPAPAPGK